MRYCENEGNATHLSISGIKTDKNMKNAIGTITK